jgi:beta-glucosidase-like glycosyl hydrolase
MYPVHVGGHNYTGWCAGKPCAVNSKEGVGATVNAALNEGGIDYNCGPLYKTNLYNALQLGAVTEADIDRAAARIYMTQIKLGMLDDAATQEYETWGAEAVDNVEARALSLRAAQESLVLLKNEGGVLPLKKGAKLAFIGPHANSTQALLSNYHGDNRLVNAHSPLAAAAAAGLDVTHTVRARPGQFSALRVSRSESILYLVWHFGMGAHGT